MTGHLPLANLYRAGPEGWPAALGRAATLGFDALLIPTTAPPPDLVEAARGLRVRLVADLHVDRAPAPLLEAVPGPFHRLAAPLMDPRQPPAPAPDAPAAIGMLEDAAALAAWWAPHVTRLGAVRLLGLDRLPGWAVPGFLAELRTNAPDALLFGWTPGLPWPVLDRIAPGVLDLVASSLPWWDGESDWLWAELARLRRIAPVVADSGDDPARQTLAAILGDGWMTQGAAAPGAPDAEALVKLRRRFAALPHASLVSAGGGPAYAVLRSDAPDHRAASKAVLGVTALRRATLHAAGPLGMTGGSFGPFRDQGGTALSPHATIVVAPGWLHVYEADARARLPAPPLARKRAELAASMPRVAIEAVSPCVENGRFPARQVVGSEVIVGCDVIVDGHEKVAACLRWHGPGEEWSDVPMAPLGNDRWSGAFPLQALGPHEYTVHAWKDVWGTYTDELAKKHGAGVPITLELQEGEALVRTAAARSRKGTAQALEAVLKALATESEDLRRDVLLADETRSAMARADDRPHEVVAGPYTVLGERAAAGFAAWYEVFPRSLSDDPNRHGTFRDVIRHLPRIHAMGFDVLYFPPFHPIGRKNRKGRNNTLTPAADDPGSPYAIGSEEGGHDALHPELGTLEDFQALRAAAAEHGLELAMDFAIQCSPDHPWLREHKDWFNWRPDGTIRYAENPPKKYEDIVNVDFYAPGAVPSLWLALADAVLHWAAQGVRLFRVDNPHTKPLPFWEWLIQEVQARYPDAVFLAEAFTRPKVMYRLAKSGFGQSYTYFTWRYTKDEFTQYLTELTQGPPRDFFRPHFFVNTPDINPVPLQTAPRQAFLVRTALASLLSGLWGLYNGFELCEATPVPGREEYLDSEKYQLRAWDWDRPGNIVAEITQLNAIRRANPALHSHLGITFLNADNPFVLCFEKATPDRSNVVLVAINLDLHRGQSSRIDVPHWRFTPEPALLDATDLLEDRRERWDARSRVVNLPPERPYAIWRIRPADEVA